MWFHSSVSHVLGLGFDDDDDDVPDGGIGTISPAFAMFLSHMNIMHRDEGMGCCFACTRFVPFVHF